jgi:hypothetical protein
MKAFTLDAMGTPPALRDDLLTPAPAAREVLVRVHASSANPVDNAIAAGMLGGMVEHESPSRCAATTPASSSGSAPTSPATPSATRSRASSCTPIRACTTAAGPS